MSNGSSQYYVRMGPWCQASIAVRFPISYFFCVSSSRAMGCVNNHIQYVNDVSKTDGNGCMTRICRTPFLGFAANDLLCMDGHSAECARRIQRNTRLIQCMKKMEGKINHSNTMKVTVIAIIRAVVVAAVATAPIPTPGAIAAAAPVLAEAVCVVMTMDRYSLSRMALPTLFEPQQKWHSFVEFSMGTTSEGSKR